MLPLYNAASLNMLHNNDIWHSLNQMYGILQNLHVIFSEDDHSCTNQQQVIHVTVFIGSTDVSFASLACINMT